MINQKIKGKETVKQCQIERERAWIHEVQTHVVRSSAPVEKEEEKAKHSLGNKWIL